MQVLEFSGLMAWATEHPERPPCVMVQHTNLLVPTICDIHVFLRLIRGEINPARRPNPRQRGCFTFNQNMPFEASNFVENFNAPAQAIAYVEQTVVSNDDTVNDL